MSRRFQWSCLLLATALIAFLVVNGCKKNDSAADASGPRQSTRVISSPLPTGEPIARIHWLGKKGILAETNSGYFAGIWAMPQSIQLQSHFLDQLSLAPLHLLFTNGPVLGTATNTLSDLTNAPSATLLRPLLDDLIENETVAEISLGTNGTLDLALAVKLDPARLPIWSSNLAQAFDSLTNAPGLRNCVLEISRAGDWTFVGIGHKDNPVVKSLEARVNVPKSPAAAGLPAYWLEADLKLAKLFPETSAKSPIELPEIEYAMLGHTQGVASSAILNFSQPLPFATESWNIPTNVIHGPINTFTAIQGLSPLISKLPFWKNLGVGDAPNQLLFWAHVAHPALTYVAAPMTNATTALPVIRERLLTKGNDWLTTNGTGQFEKPAGYDGIFCTAGNPLLGPFLRLETNTHPNALLAGWGASNSTNVPPPEWLYGDLEGKTNQVFYDREMTGPRIGSWFYLGQGFRVILWKAQVPFNSPALVWLQKPGRMLGLETTRGFRTGPNQLRFERVSSVGFNSVELQLLADWLESPQFPRGLHTTVAPGNNPRLKPKAVAAGKKASAANKQK